MSCSILNIIFFAEKKLINAAEEVANTIGGDKTKTTSDLLQKVLASRIEILKEDQLKNTYVNYYICAMLCPNNL